MNETEEQRARKEAGSNGGGRKAREDRAVLAVLRRDMVRRDIALAALCGLALAQALPVWLAVLVAFIIWGLL